MGMYKAFETDKSLEKSGIVIDYGDFRVTVARAGGANKNYTKALEFYTRPYRRAIQTETLPQEVNDKIMMQVYAQAVVMDWETKKGTDENGDPIFIKGIESKDGDIIPVTQDNLVETFKALPDLFEDLVRQSGKSALFRKELDLEDAKN